MMKACWPRTARPATTFLSGLVALLAAFVCCWGATAVAAGARSTLLRQNRKLKSTTGYGLPEVKSGAVCGYGIGKCPEGECCNVLGLCTRDPRYCTIGCQPDYSGAYSSCGRPCNIVYDKQPGSLTTFADVDTIAGSTTDQDCNTKCISNSKCKYWLRSNKMSTCWLGTKPTRNEITAAPGDFRSGPRCDGFCNIRASTNPTSGFSVLGDPTSASTDQECIDQCSAHPNCLYWKRDTSSKTCWLSDALVPPSNPGTSSSSVNSGPRCNRAPFITQRNFRLEVTRGPVNTGSTVPRPAYLINGEFPAPTLRANAGDRIVATVVNLINESITIHWHGFLMRGSNGMDGVPGISTMAILENSQFTYDFTADEPGTLWYHSHYAHQYIDGIKGMFIIDEPNPPVGYLGYKPPLAPTYDDSVESTVSLSDWYQKEAEDMMDDFMKTEGDGTEPTPEMIIMNGVGQSHCTASTCRYALVPARPPTENELVWETTWDTTSGCASYGQKVQATSPVVAHTKIRLINTGAFGPAYFSIDSHYLKVVASDTTNEEAALEGAYYATSVWLNVGERLDLAVRPMEGVDVSATRTFWMRARLDNVAFPDEKEASENNTVAGILSYDHDVQQIVSLKDLASVPRSKDTSESGVAYIAPYSDKLDEYDDIANGKKPTEYITNYWNYPTFDKWYWGPGTICNENHPASSLDTAITLNIEMAYGTHPYNHKTTQVDKDGKPIYNTNVTRAHFNGISSAHEPWSNSGSTLLDVLRPDYKAGYGGKFLESSVEALELLNTSNPSFEVGVGPYVKGFLVYRIPIGTVQKIIVNNLDGGQHPLHLHGHSFFVTNYGKANAGPFNPNNITRDTRVAIPFGVRRDSVTINENSYIVFDVIADNPGIWLMHCHIEWHAMAGLAVIFLFV